MKKRTLKTRKKTVGRPAVPQAQQNKSISISLPVPLIEKMDSKFPVRRSAYVQHLIEQAE